MESAGEQLKKLRLEKGLSLEDVHKKTKLHLKVLKALEEDNLVNVNPVYVKGFLKIYCKFLGVEPASLGGSNKEQPSRSARLRAPETQNISLKLKPANKLFKKDKLLPYLNKKTFILAGSVIVLALLFFLVGKLMGARKHRVVAAPAPAKYIPPIPVKPKVNNVRSEEPLTRQAPVTTGVRLVMRARENCYIQLKSDGHTIFHGTLKKGKSETWTAKERIEFSLSNASAVSLELNGEPVPALAKKKRMLKSVLITRDGHITIQ